MSQYYFIMLLLGHAFQTVCYICLIMIGLVGTIKLITKINDLISLLARYHCLNVESFCSKYVALNLLNVHKL